MSDLRLSQQDVDYLGRVAFTEIGNRGINRYPEEHARMTGGVIDTILNRVASPSYPNTISGVVNQRNQFTGINGPARYANGLPTGARGSVQATPRAPTGFQSVVDQHVWGRVNGAPSVVGSGLNFANPGISDDRNRGWINALEGPTFGWGNFRHKHGTAWGKPVEATVAAAPRGSATRIGPNGPPSPAPRPSDIPGSRNYDPMRQSPLPTTSPRSGYSQPQQFQQEYSGPAALPGATPPMQGPFSARARSGELQGSGFRPDERFGTVRNAPASAGPAPLPTNRPTDISPNPRSPDMIRDQMRAQMPVPQQQGFFGRARDAINNRPVMRDMAIGGAMGGLPGAAAAGLGGVMVRRAQPVVNRMFGGLMDPQRVAENRAANQAFHAQQSANQQALMAQANAEGRAVTGSLGPGMSANLQGDTWSITPVGREDYSAGSFARGTDPQNTLLGRALGIGSSGGFSGGAWGQP